MLMEDSRVVTAEQKEATAIGVMRHMLEDYSVDYHEPFEKAMLSFAQSNTYQDLFDFDTAIWKEGPDYLRDLYEEEKSNTTYAAYP